MNNNRKTLRPKQTLLWIMVPLLTTVVGLRVYLHLVHMQHVYVGGYMVRHLFSGVLLVIPAAFLLAFAPCQGWLVRLASGVLGVGSGLILDEVVFLVATKATEQDYVSPLSLGGSVVCTSLAVMLLLVFYRFTRD